MAKKKEITKEPILIELEEVVELEEENSSKEDTIDVEEVEPTEVKEISTKSNNNRKTIEVEFLEDSIYFKKGERAITSSMNAYDLVNLKKAKIV